MDSKGRNSSGVAVTIAVLSAAAWLLFATYFVPSLIDAAYRGQSAPIFNAMVAGRNMHPLSDYLASWNSIAFHIFLGLLACGLVTSVLVQPGVQSVVWGGMQGARAMQMGVSRKLAVYGLLAVIAGGSAVSIARGSDYWPFSSYAMYSQVAQTFSFSEYRVYGVTAGSEGQAREFPLVDYRYTQPFDNARINDSFKRMCAHPQNEAQIQAGLADFLGRYEKLRIENKHAGPALQAMRLYRVSWKLDPLAKNVEQPDQKEFLGEADAPADQP